MAEESRVSFNNRDYATNNYYDMRKRVAPSCKEPIPHQKQPTQSKDIQNIHRFIERHMNELTTSEILTEIYPFLGDEEHQNLNKNRHNRRVFMKILLSQLVHIGFPEVRPILHRFKYPINRNGKPQCNEDTGIGEIDVGPDSDDCDLNNYTDGSMAHADAMIKPKLKREHHRHKRSHHKHRDSDKRKRSHCSYKHRDSRGLSSQSRDRYRDRQLNDRYSESNFNKTKSRRNAQWNLNQSRTSPSREFKKYSKHSKPVKTCRRLRHKK
eukprot:25813_1